jgi:hypothetical protein
MLQNAFDSQALSPGLLSEQLLLKLCYRLDVPLGGRGDRGVR